MPAELAMPSPASRTGVLSAALTRCEKMASQMATRRQTGNMRVMTETRVAFAPHKKTAAQREN